VALEQKCKPRRPTQARVHGEPPKTSHGSVAPRCCALWPRRGARGERRAPRETWWAHSRRRGVELRRPRCCSAASRCHGPTLASDGFPGDDTGTRTKAVQQVKSVDHRSL
jgi:hypothetical protein